MRRKILTSKIYISLEFFGFRVWRYLILKPIFHNVMRPAVWFKSSPSLPVVSVVFMGGLGNNLFQYAFANILASKDGALLSCSPPSITKSEQKTYKINKKYQTVVITGGNIDFHKVLQDNRGKNIIFSAYPEDYTLYMEELVNIKNLFRIPLNIKTNEKDLVVHLRLGDRLVDKNTFADGDLGTAPELIEAIKKFDYENLHIVTDMPFWREIDVNDVASMRFHINYPHSLRISPEISVKYFNFIYRELNKFKPIVRINHSVEDDFHFMASFSQLLFEHGTLAWWVAVLGSAKKVGVYKRWRPFKGENNKNLGRTNYSGWFGWGH